MADLFLEFTSRQIRRYYGLFGLTDARHFDILSRWMNVAAWLCDDYCLIPVGFPLECRVLRQVLVRKAELLKRGVVELPLRGTFDAFVRRRRETYAPYSDDFEDLYTDDIPAFVERFAVAFKDRRSQSADSLVDRWSAGPDTSSLWLPVKRLGVAATSRIARIPESIHKSEAGIVWDGIRKRLDAADHRMDDELQRILQSDFVESYCEEYGTETLAELRNHWRDLRRAPSSDPTVNYRNFEASLGPLGLRDLIERLSAETMVELRQRAGYLTFISAYRALAGDRSSLRRIAAMVGAADGKRGAGIAGSVLTRTRASNDATLTLEEIDALDEVLADAGRRMQSESSIAAQGPPGPDHVGAEDSGDRMMEAKPRIAIFIALAEERRVLEKSDLAFRKDVHDEHLVTEKDGVVLEVYCANGMGRVAAAVATMGYLHETTPRPDLLIVAGLAGGFPSVGMTEGALVVPEQVFDLALRKVRNDTIEFRPEPYRTDTRFKNYLQSNKFDSEKWSSAAHAIAEWPAHLRPNIRFDPLMSVDEVVSSTPHAELLRVTSSKLAGVEMEAGGVFAAAVKFGVPVAVIRGVSDNADPSKADNAWRGRAMKTIVSLLNTVNLAEMLKQKT